MSENEQMSVYWEGINNIQLWLDKLRHSYIIQGIIVARDRNIPNNRGIWDNIEHIQGDLNSFRKLINSLAIDSVSQNNPADILVSMRNSPPTESDTPINYNSSRHQISPQLIQTASRTRRDIGRKSVFKILLKKKKISPNDQFIFKNKSYREKFSINNEGQLIWSDGNIYNSFSMAARLRLISFISGGYQTRVTHENSGKTIQMLSTEDS